MIKVLVVEDDPMLAEIHKNFVQKVEGFDVIGIAEDGVKALEILNRESVDLIILDVYLPRMDGLTLIQNMRKSDIMSDVILVTAAKDVEQVETALKYGAFDYLVKPFEFKRLKNSLKKYMERFQGLHVDDVIEQAEIDRIFNHNDRSKYKDLPKGLHIMTLERIRKAMGNMVDDYIDIEVIAESISMSKVSARRYLDYLEKIDEVEIEMSYGGRGRPSYKYRLKNRKL